ncbi:MAG: GIY-YIG nuclease family protein [Pseudomonadota bacterium]
MTQPPFETRELRAKLLEYLNQKIEDPTNGERRALGSYKFGVYAFFDYDKEPIYVGQTAEGIKVRIGRHLTNQRTDAVAMKVLDPFEVYEVEVWPLAQYDTRSTKDSEARAHLNWLEYDIFQHFLTRSLFNAVLNEKDPFVFPAKSFVRPMGIRGTIVSQAVFELRSHPDTRIARRAETLSLLAKVISERQVQKGLRKTLLTQAKRLAWLAERRLGEFAGLPDDAEEPEKSV